MIAGSAKGRRITCADGKAVRPTASRVREAVFSILGSRVPDARVLDLYAGVGTLGMEALSRGAAHVDFVESHRLHAALIHRNLEHLGFDDRASVACQDVRRYLQTPRGDGYQIVFVDPPYNAGELPHVLPALFRANIIDPSGVIVVEHARSAEGPPGAPWKTTRSYHYGKTTVTLFFPALPTDDPTAP